MTTVSITTTPAYYSIKEWDDTEAIVLAVAAERNEDVFIEYQDGVCHRVARRYFVEELKARPHAVCACGSNRPVENPGWGQWPCCPDCGQN